MLQVWFQSMSLKFRKLKIVNVWNCIATVNGIKMYPNRERSENITGSRCGEMIVHIEPMRRIHVGYWPDKFFRFSPLSIHVMSNALMECMPYSCFISVSENIMIYSWCSVSKQLSCLQKTCLIAYHQKTYIAYRMWLNCITLLIVSKYFNGLISILNSGISCLPYQWRPHLMYSGSSIWGLHLDRACTPAWL